MTKSDNENGAFGQPGIRPRWTHGGKDGVGTAYAASSRIWFTLWNGIITEVYYPTVDVYKRQPSEFANVLEEITRCLAAAP